MRLSTKAQYAVRAMVDLCFHSGGSPVTLREIAEREDIPLNYLEQLFHRLRKAKIVLSVRGPGGGYLPAAEASGIRVRDIIDAVEELSPLSCLEGESCGRDRRCTTHRVWQGLSDRIRDFLDSITLEDLVREAAAGEKQ